MVILAVSLGYILLLFGIAYWGDRQAERGRSWIANPWVYSLSMAVYCTAWTFNGSVGRASATGFGFLPIYIGPTLMAALFWVVLRKIVRISKAERLTSIADFIAARYGKSTSLGVWVTVIAVVGVVPYLSLQLKAIASSFLLIWQSVGGPREIAFGQASLMVAGALALFAILFGTRHLDLTEQHEGLVLAIAFESLVKLIAFLAVGLWVTFGLFDGFGDLFGQALARPDLQHLLTFGEPTGAWVAMTYLAMMAILFLPRQFQVSVVGCVNEQHLRTASWLFPLYLLIINIFVLPIALAGSLTFPRGQVDADSYVLALPLWHDHSGLALLVFLGGLSAATGMVIVETVALSTMVANDLVLPILLRRTDQADQDFSQVLLFVRRMAIVALLALAYGYILFTRAGSLVSIGLISFAAVAQFAPAFLGGLYWQGASRVGALWGLIAGFVVWAYTLPLPTLAVSGWIPEYFVAQGPWGIAWLKPYALFGLEGLDPIAHALWWSLLANVGAFVVGSAFSTQSAVEHSQAKKFVDVLKTRLDAELPMWAADTPVGVVRSLLERFLGKERTDRALSAWAEAKGVDLKAMRYADAELVAHAEKLLAGTTGAASARVALASVAQPQDLGAHEVLMLLDETSRVIATSRELEEKSAALEAASAELRDANEKLRQLDRLKDDFLSTMAHELRTPLTSIRAFAEILHDNPELETARRVEFLRIIAKENERLTRLINQVLDITKIEAADADWRFETVDLGALVQEAVDATSQLARSCGVAISIVHQHPPATLFLDRDRVLQVLLNLLSNAIKFSPAAGGWIEVQTEKPGHEVLVAVSDNGPGVDETEREAIFERFHQVTRPLAGHLHGTGLGLAICRRILGRHGGRIWVERSRRGGARFVFALPANR
jgi:Na+/proline symporter/signal transduction histidine kinase